MGRHGGNSCPPPAAATPSWAVRIHRDNGDIAGSGILLAPDLVLTCAHVVRRGVPHTAEFVAAESAAIPARVLDDAYVPESRDGVGDPRGDVALLRLQEPASADTTYLHRLAAPQRRVRMYGFPYAYGGGIFFRAVIIGGCGRDGQVSMAPVSPGELPGSGFSGAGVVDEGTGLVMGMVLSVQQEPGGPSFSFMSPTETIVKHLPQVRPRTRGKSAVDPPLVSRGPGEPVDDSFAERLADWLRGDGRRVKVSVVSHGDRRRSAALHRAITLADRELRAEDSVTEMSSTSPGALPPAGGHDLAVHVAGLRVADIVGRIAARIGLRLDTTAPVVEQLLRRRLRLTVVLVGVDEAANPSATLDLLERLAAAGMRLLVVFRREGSAYRRALEIHPSDADVTPQAGLVARLDEFLAGPGAELYRLREKVRADTDAVMSALVRAHALREHVASLEAADASAANGPLLGAGEAAELAAYERSIEVIRHRVEQAVEVLTAMVRRRDELRGRLDAYPVPQPVPGEEGSASLAMRCSELYLGARALLYARPCDLEKAERAVTRYLGYVEASANADVTPGGGDRAP